MKQRAVFFDLAGTLTDPKLGITRCIEHAMTRLGRVSPAADELDWCIGPPLRGSFSRLLDSPDDELVEQAITLYRERYATVGLFENTLYAGIPDALRALRGSGYRTFVVTSKPGVYAVRIVEHFSLTEFFDRVYGSELDGTRNDKDELIAYALANERLDPAQVVMVGDREHDAVGARKCDVRFVGVTYGYGTEAELRAHGASALAASPREIVGAVDALFGADRQERRKRID